MKRVIAYETNHPTPQTSSTPSILRTPLTPKLFFIHLRKILLHTSVNKSIAAADALEEDEFGGLVEEGSVKRGEGTSVRFVVTDTLKTVPVSYKGVLPDLFREGQGVVAEGVLGPDGQLTADTVLAKHDENYMPPEVADALKARGVKLGEGAQHKSASTAGGVEPPKQQ